MIRSLFFSGFLFLSCFQGSGVEMNHCCLLESLGDMHAFDRLYLSVVCCRWAWSDHCFCFITAQRCGRRTEKGLVDWSIVETSGEQFRRLE